MSTFKLRFHNPNFLNHNKVAIDEDKPQWHHIDGSDLEINIEDWVIHKINKKGSCLLSKCEIDENNHIVRFTGETHEGEFKLIDHAFAISMLGQIIPKEELIHYLKQMENTFDNSKEEKRENSAHQTQQDEPKENQIP
jgi:hypothetical protein